MRLKNFLINLFCIVCAFLFCDSVISQETEGQSAVGEDTVVCQLLWFHQFEFAGFYAALEKGFYKEEGLNVVFNEGNPSLDPVNVLITNRVEYAVGDADVLLHRLNGNPLVVLAVIFQHSPQAFLTRKESGITTIEQLKGKRAMMLPGTRTAELEAVLLEAGLAKEDIHLADVSFSEKILHDTTIDAFGIYTTTLPYYFEQANIPYNIISPLDYGIDFYGDCLFTSEQEIRNHPERAEAFRRATLKGWDYAMDHPEEIIDIIVDKYRSRKDRQALLYEYKVMDNLLQPNIIEIGYMNKNRWERMAETYMKLGMASSSENLEGFIFTETGKALKTIPVRKILIKVFIAGGICGSILLVFALWLYYHRIVVRRKKIRYFSNDQVIKMIQLGENANIEFKSTVRLNIKTDKFDKNIQFAWLKNVCAFLNTDGGVLFIGVADDGTVCGIEQDQFQNDDKCMLHVGNLIKAHIGLEFVKKIDYHLRKMSEKTVLIIQCYPSKIPAFMKKDNTEEFYVRNGAASRTLSISESLKYIKQKTLPKNMK